jgi:hypothetical protein
MQQDAPAGEQRLVYASSYALSRTGARSGIGAGRQRTRPCGTSSSSSPHASCGSSASAASSSPTATQGLHRAKRYNTYGPNLPGSQFKKQ